MLIVGGAGSLYIDSTHHTQLRYTPDFLNKSSPVDKAMSKALNLLKESKGVHWIYLSPAAVFDASGKRTGKYTVAGEIFETDKKGNSYISYENYAIKMIDEVEKNTHPNQRFSVHQ